MTPKTEEIIEKEIEHILIDFGTNYNAEYRWINDRINNASAVDWLRGAFLYVSQLRDSEIEQIKKEAHQQGREEGYQEMLDFIERQAPPQAPQDKPEK